MGRQTGTHDGPAPAARTPGEVPGGGVQQPIRLPRPADGGSMMPLAAAPRTLGADLCAATPKAWPVTITPLDEHRGAVCEPGLAGVFSERTAKFAAGIRAWARPPMTA